MKKKFTMENDVGILVEYTVLGITEESVDTYVIYTDFFPSDNELGIRLYAGQVLDLEKFSVSHVSKEKAKQLVDAFILEIIKTGKKIKRVK